MLDRPRAGPRNSADATYPRQRGDRITLQFAALHMSAQAQSGRAGKADICKNST